MQTTYCLIQIGITFFSFFDFHRMIIGHSVILSEWIETFVQFSSIKPLTILLWEIIQTLAFQIRLYTMTRLKMPRKHSRRSERESTPPSDEENPPLSKTRFDECSILIGKPIDFTSFTFSAPSFQLGDNLSEWIGFLLLRCKK